VAGFEGMLSADGEHSVETGVAEFLDRIVDLARELDKRMLFQPSPEVVLTAGGSLYFDSVVERFAEFRSQHPTRIVIRSGCYITHDDGIVHRDSPMGAVPRTGERERFLPAIEVWGAVLSRPEPTRVLVGVGKRDASSDGPLPLAKKVLRRSRGAVESIEGITTAALNDQHAYLDIEPGMPLDVGDLIGFGISHPCTTFDKWRTLMMVDDAYRVTELVETYF
jgi:D-serine dehydratase